MRAFLAVFWSFFGVRKRGDLHSDVENLSLVQLIVAGLIGAIIFVISLILLIRWILS